MERQTDLAEAIDVVADKDYRKDRNRLSEGCDGAGKAACI